MPDDAVQALHLADDAATAALGARLAGLCRPGDLVLLEGDLGAGKTALARAVIRALAADPGLDVPSPSFALVQPYEAGGLAVIHADLYRLGGEGEVEELGLFDDPRALVLVEWPGRAPGLGDRADWRIALALAPGGSGRVARVWSRDGRAAGLAP